MNMKLYRRPKTLRLWALPLTVLACAILVPVLLLSGCGGDGETTTSAIADSTTVSSTSTSVDLSTSTSETATTEAETTTSVAETTTTTEPLSNAEILLPNGNVRAMGYIDKVWESGGTRYISIDYAQMLTGEEARQAAIEAGVIQPGDYLDNDYFIVNDNPRKREFTVSATATFATSTFGGGGLDQPTTWAQFKSFWSASPPAGGEHLHELPWWIERTGGEVISIEEQYLP